MLIIAPLWKSGGYTGFALSFRHSVILSFHNLSNENFSSHFSQELWGLEDWNLVHIWTVGRCIMCTGIRLLLLICSFISSFFFLSNFQTLKFFVTLFSGTVRPRRLKLGTHGQWADVLCIPELGCCCLFVRLLYPRHLCQGVYSSFVCLFVRLFVHSYFRPVRGITSKFYVQATRVEYISPTTHQKAFIFGA